MSWTPRASQSARPASSACPARRPAPTARLAAPAPPARPDAAAPPALPFSTAFAPVRVRARPTQKACPGVPNCVSSLACFDSAQLARQARSANLALPALVRLHALARPSILTDPLTPRSCLLRARFSLHRWLVQRRPGQHVHVVPEQQCERGELVDVHLRRWLLPGWQRLLARMHQYVVVHSCVPRPSWKAHSVPRPSSLRPSSPCPSSPRPSSPRPSSPRPSSPRSDSLQRQHVQRDRRFGDLHCLPRGQHEQCWRDGMHLHRRLLERWQRQLPRLHRYVRCLHGSRAQLATY